jgi:hypothetical protein
MTNPTLVPDQEQDRNDGKEWSVADLDDLALALKDGGTIDDVRNKAKALGLIGD